MKKFNYTPIPYLRKKLSSKIFTINEAPIIVYTAVVLALVITWLLRSIFDLAEDFFVELLGAAFTLFIIDVLLVRSKSKRWKVVQDDLDYLIARNINRLRDGLSIRAFNFNPDIEDLDDLRIQRTDYLKKIEKITPSELMAEVNEKELFTSISYQYFKEKAEDIWSILNMKYSEYLSPVLVSQLINLHIHLNDVCGHINQYRKSERFLEDKEFYRKNGLEGIVFNLKEITLLVNILKEEGYSEPARME